MDHPALLPVHEMCHFLHSFAVEGSVELLKFGGSLFKISSLTAIFPSQTENIQVTLPLENHLEGRVGFTRGSLECNPEIPAFPGEEN